MVVCHKLKSRSKSSENHQKKEKDIGKTLIGICCPSLELQREKSMI